MSHEGLLYGGGFTQLWIQVKGVVAVGVFVSASSFALWRLVDLVMGLRVSEEEELVGLDLSEMGMEAYPQTRDGVGRSYSPAGKSSDAPLPVASVA
jgi:ammonia channel protein AmtB